MSKKNWRPYQPINFDLEREKIVSENQLQAQKITQNPMMDKNLIGTMIEMFSALFVSLGWMLYQAYIFGLAQIGLTNTIIHMAISVFIFLLFVLVGGISLGYGLSSQGKRWGKVLLPVSLILWVVCTYFIGNYFITH